MRFKEISAAYEVRRTAAAAAPSRRRLNAARTRRRQVLSDARERAWYDAHRESILRDGA